MENKMEKWKKKIRARAVRNSLDKTLNVEEFLFLSGETVSSWEIV